MKSRFAHILHAVYCEPWLIRPETHSLIAAIVQQHVSGLAHQPGGVAAIWDDEANKKPQAPYEMVDGVAVIPISGVMGKRLDSFDRMSGCTDVDDAHRSLDLAMADRGAKGIVLHFDSPGGTVTGTAELGDHVFEASHEKPVIAFTDTKAASAAYWVASQAFAVVASRSAVVGSVGVYLPVLDSSVAYAAHGYKQEVFKGGKLKAIGVEGTSLSDEQRAHLQERVDMLHAEFRAAVRAGRGRNIPDSEMEGQCFFGPAAVANGMVDELGDLRRAVDMASRPDMVRTR